MGTDLLKRHRFTVEDYHRMADAGILKPDHRVELIRGEVVEMSPIGTRHAACVSRLTEFVIQKARQKATIGPQNPVRLENISEPQPDLLVLRRRDDFYVTKHPQPEDVLLVVEVCDTTLAYDRKIKVPLYAETGVPEVWLVDLNKSVIEVFRDPTPQGFRHHHTARSGDTLALELLPELQLAVDDILV